MTIDEALKLIRQTEGCWVVFNSETGEVLSVVSDGPDETVQDRLVHLNTLSSYNQPVKTRHFQSATVTRQALDREKGESDRISTRVRVITQWSEATTEQLLQVLERGHYDYPMNKDFDSRVIVDHLWELHRGELDLAARKGLAALTSSAAPCESARKNLRSYVAALNFDEEHLKAIWTGALPGRDSWADALTLMDAFAHVRTKNQEIISDMLHFFDLSMPFGLKFDTMVSLGKIGPTAGERAATVIRRTVYDSETSVIAVRDRVLERVVSSEVEWIMCSACCYGSIRKGEGHGPNRCSVCLGLGYRHVDG